MNKYWILQRLSLFIGFILYIIYGTVIYIKYINDGFEKENDLQFVVGVVGGRFLSFIFEEMVDIAIDGQLHNDLLTLNINRQTDNTNTNIQNDEQANETTQLLLHDNQLNSAENSSLYKKVKKYIKGKTIISLIKLTLKKSNVLKIQNTWT